MKEAIRRAFLEAGASVVGFAEAREIPEEEARRYSGWIESGKNAGMDYLARHVPLRINPSYVLENAATVISMAFSYAPPARRDERLPGIACYALGKDYHDVIRKRLEAAIEPLRKEYGGEWRICVDSAPLPERYWAKECGIGIQGRNGSIIVENCGCYNFLAEVLTTHQMAPDAPQRGFCEDCGACRKACPTGALQEDGTVDARKCLSYLTIEHRGEWTGEGLAAVSTPAGRHTLFGCDICVRVCPRNAGVRPTEIEEFQPQEKILRLTPEEVMAMTQEEFSKVFRGSPLKRTKLQGLRRNATNTLRHNPD